MHKMNRNPNASWCSATTCSNSVRSTELYHEHKFIVRLFTMKVEQLKCEKGQTDRQTITQNAKVEKS